LHYVSCDMAKLLRAIRSTSRKNGTSEDEPRNPGIYGADTIYNHPDGRGKPAIHHKNKKPTPQQAKKWQESIENVLNDPKGRAFFSQHLAGEFALENLEFWNAVKKLKQENYSGERLKKEVKEIFDLYIDDSAEKLINVNGRLKLSIREAIEDPSPDMFDDAQKHVYGLMKEGAYQRFITDKIQIYISGNG